MGKRGSLGSFDQTERSGSFPFQLSCLIWARLRWDDTDEKHLEMRVIDFFVDWFSVGAGET